MAKGRWVAPAARHQAPPVASIPLPVEMPAEATWAMVGEALRRLEFYTETLKPSFLQECLTLTKSIRFGERAGEFRFRVGEREVVGYSYAPPSVNLPTKLYEMKCNRCMPAWACVHVAAVTVALGSQVPEIKAVLSTPGWAMALTPLLEETAPKKAPPPPPSPDDRGVEPGLIRYVLKAGEPNDLLGGARLSSAFLQRSLVRAPRKAGYDPIVTKFPASLSEAAQKIDTISDVDREIDELAQQIELLEDLVRYNPAGLGRAAASLRSLESQWMALLPQVAEVYVGEVRVRVSPDPITIRLEVEDGKEGQLRLRWLPQVKALVPIGRGYLQTQDDVLRPVAANTHPGVIRLLQGQMPRVPAEQIEDFLERFIPSVRVPLELRTRHLRALPAGAVPPRPRLIVTTQNGALSLEPRFAYAIGEAVAEIAADDLRPLLRVEGATGKYKVVNRDPHAEAALVRALSDAGFRASSLGEDAALDFLLEGLPKVQAIGFEVFVDQGAQRMAPKGKLDPQIRVGSGLDWFDLKVSFTHDGQEVSAEAVLASWREGRKYHKLPDGQMLRLPESWLARHAGTLGELQDVRAASGNKMSAFAAPLVAELLEEAGESKALARWKEIARKVLDFDGVPEWPIPPGVQAEPREYQKRGFHWLVWLRDLDLGGVLADDMGLGKTLQTLLLLFDTHGDPDGPPSLVVAPTSVVHNWAAEAQKFVPDLRIYIHHGSNRETKLPRTGVDLIVTSYALLRYDEKIFTRDRFRYVVLDEAQMIKNPDSQIAAICQRLQSDHRLALTGTPLENNLVELWSIYQFLMPGFFGTRQSFAGRYATAVHKQQNIEALATLRKRIRPFILRRRKEEVATELPPRTEQVLYCELGAQQRRLYEQVKATFREQVMARIESTGGVGGATIQILEALMRLRQACCDPRLLPFEEARRSTSSAKRSLLRDTLEEIVAEGHRTLIFSQWPSLLRLVEEDLRALDLTWLYLDGHTKDRKQLVDRWNRPDGPPVFLISLKAGGVGLNLTGADHVIHLDPWWNPAVERQATDRAHRIGQTKPVVVYKLVARDTVEEKILELQARKQALFDATVDAEKMLTESLTREDLESVFAPSGPTESVGTDLAEESGVELDSPLAGVLTPLRAPGERGGGNGERGGGGNGERGGNGGSGGGSRARPPRRRTRGGGGGGGGRPNPPTPQS
jgi:superfamily II DNA or RNA helicase